MVAPGSDDGIVHLWDATKGALQRTWSLQGIASILEFSPNGPYLRAEFGPLETQSRCGKDSRHMNLVIFVDQGQWIKLNSEKVLWLPPEFRPSCSAIHGSVFALGCASGRISFIGFRL